MAPDEVRTAADLRADREALEKQEARAGEKRRFLDVVLDAMERKGADWREAADSAVAEIYGDWNDHARDLVGEIQDEMQEGT